MLLIYGFSIGRDAARWGGIVTNPIPRSATQTADFATGVLKLDKSANQISIEGQIKNGQNGSTANVKIKDDNVNLSIKIDWNTKDTLTATLYSVKESGNDDMIVKSISGVGQLSFSTDAQPGDYKLVLSRSDKNGSGAIDFKGTCTIPPDGNVTISDTDVPLYAGIGANGINSTTQLGIICGIVGIIMVVVPSAIFAINTKRARNVAK
jgi:hypothetical protein